MMITIPKQYTTLRTKLEFVFIVGSYIRLAGTTKNTKEGIIGSLAVVSASVHREFHSL